MAFSGYHRPCQRRYLSLELHRQCVFPALAVVGGVDGVNVPPPARELGGVIPADTVELHGMDAAQRTDKPLRAVLPMIQLHKVHHAPQDSRPEGIRSALPRFHDVPQGFAVDFFAQLVVQLQRRAHAADTVVAQLHTVVVEGQPHPVGGCDKRLGRRIAAHHLGAQLDARRQGCGVTVLLRKEQGFLLHRQTGVDLAEDRAVLAAVKEDAALDGVLPVHHIVPAVAEADLRLVNDVLVEVPGDQLHPLALHAPLVDLAGIDQLAAVDDRKLVRRVDTNERIVVVQAHRISSLILQMYFSASSKISATCCLRFGMVSRLGLKVKLYSSRWIMA